MADSYNRHGKITLVAVVLLISLGIYGLIMMNKDEFPTFEIKMGLVAGVYPGATSTEVEQQLTRPLEEVLFSIPEVSRSKTYSISRNGICYIYVDLDCSDRKKDQVWSKIKHRLSTVKASLPAGVLAVAVLDEFSSTSALLVAMESPDKSYAELQEYAEDLSTRLKRIEELASVKIIGTQGEEIAVELDPDRISAYGISPASLFIDYRGSSTGLPAGSFDDGEMRAPVHVRSTVGAEHEVASHIVFSDPSGSIVRLGDIATIERRMSRPSSFVNYNGNSALILSIEMRPDNNIIFFGNEVTSVIDAFREDLPDSVTVSKITDQPKVVEKSILSFLRDLLLAMAVVIAVMLILFPLRSALIACTGVPVTTAIAIAIMYVTGITLNTVTLAALIVVLGMIVDDSVITIDGYMDKLGRGLGRIDAARASVKELFMPMLMATMAIGLMFFPCTFIITGYLGDFVKMFPWVICIALMTSLAYAVLVVPSLMTRFIGSSKISMGNFLSRMQNRFFDFIQKGYEKMLSFCFRHSAAVLGAALLSVVAGVLFFLSLNVQMMPMAARDCFAVEIYAEANAPLSSTRTVTDSLERLFLADGRVKSVTTFTGEGAPRFNATYHPKVPAPNFAQIIVNTVSNEATEQLLGKYDRSIHSMFPEADIRLKQMDYQAVNAQVEVHLKGPDVEALRPLADSIRAEMYRMDDLLQWVHATGENSCHSISVELDPDEAARLGVGGGSVAVALGTALEGLPAATIYEGDDAIPVRIYYKGDCTYGNLLDMSVETAFPGVSVPLRQVADLVPEWTPDSYARYSGEPTIVVGADMRYGKGQPAAMKRIQQYVETSIKPVLPEGATVDYGGLSATNKVVMPQIVLSFIAAVLVLFLFLLIHFRKLSLAVLGISMSLLCLFGCFFGLWAFDLDFSITAVLGLISLVGIIIRNGIILFDYAGELREEKGLSVRDAAFEAGCRRMRPIFLTSITTALGVLPMVLHADPLWNPMGVVICFGTVLSIVLIVMVMPVSYWLIYRKEDNR